MHGGLVFTIKKARSFQGVLIPLVIGLSLLSSAQASATTPISVTSVTPNAIKQATKMAITIDGLGFVKGDKIKVSGKGVKVASITVVNGSTMTAKATVSATAAVGVRNVTVKGRSGSATCTNCLTIAPLGATLYVSPTDQTVISGNEVAVDVVLNTATYAVNTVQSVFQYSASHFNAVSVVPGVRFGIIVGVTEATGSIGFTVGNTAPVTGTQIAVMITLKATGSGSSALTLSAVCPPGDYALTCSAAYDATTSNNDLSNVVGTTYSVT